MNKKHLFISAVALASLTTACSDYDNNYDERKLAYEEAFKDVFGNIDPKQDWNMVQQYTADIKMGKDVNGTMSIYTDGPTVPGSQYIGKVKVNNGNAKLNFDGLKNSPFFYVELADSKGKVTERGYYAVEGNTLTIQTPKNAPASVPTLGDIVNLPVQRIVPEAIEDLISNRGTYENYYDMCDKLKAADGVTAKWDKNNKNDETHPNGLYYKDGDKVIVPNLYRLNGVDFSQHDNGFTGKYLKTFFGNYINTSGVAREGVFKEAIDHVALMHYANDDYHVSPDVIYTITDGDDADGFGQLELDCIWRGTAATYDFFGYYYYDPKDYVDGEPSAEDLWNMPKYILINEKEAGTGMYIGGTPATSLTQGKTAQWKVWTDPHDVNNLHYGTQDWKDLGGEECATYMNNDDFNLIRGTKIRLAYFGLDGKSGGSFNFPKGTKVGFFMGWNQGNTSWSNRLLFSKCDKTYQLFRRMYQPNDAFKSTMETDLLPASFKSTHTENDDARGYEGEDVRPFAATFKLGDVTILGFGDEVAGDKDLNDICFIVNGDIEDVPELNRDDIPDPETQSWILTCEDLGNIEDFDFNDVVVKVTHAAEDTKATLTAMAAGGTLPVTLIYKDQEIPGPNGNTEFHSWFLNGSIPTTTMINTGRGINGVAGGSVTVPVEPTFTMSSTVEGNKMGGFSVKVERDNRDDNKVRQDITAPENGDAPQMMCLPGNWVWPTEKSRIDAAYPAFGTWGENYNVTTWYKKYNRAYLVAQPDYESQDPTPVTPSDEKEPTSGEDNNTYTINATATDFTNYDSTISTCYAIDLSSIEFPQQITSFTINFVADKEASITQLCTNASAQTAFTTGIETAKTNTVLTPQSWAYTNWPLKGTLYINVAEGAVISKAIITVK